MQSHTLTVSLLIESGLTYPPATAGSINRVQAWKKPSARVAKPYILERIKNRIPPNQLHNAAIEAGTDTDDGIENIHAGAEAVFAEAMAQLADRYKVNKKGWITRK